MWAAEKVEARPPSPRSHLEGAEIQSVGNIGSGWSSKTRQGKVALIVVIDYYYYFTTIQHLT